MADTSERTVRGWGKRNERVAGETMCAHLGGAFREVDPGGGPVQTHDLEIDLPDGSTWAVEVTQHTDEAVTQMLEAVQRRTWHFPDLDRGWFVHHIGVLSVSALHRELPGLLKQLEDAGVTKWMEATSARPPDDAPYDRLHELGVRLVISPADDRPGNVFLGRASFGNWCDLDAVNRAATELANRPDNARKLAVANADRSVLFVWVDPMSTDAGLAIDVGDLPVDSPQMPDHIHEVWMACAYENPRIWTWNRENGWHKRQNGAPPR